MKVNEIELHSSVESITTDILPSSTNKSEKFSAEAVQTQNALNSKPFIGKKIQAPVWIIDNQYIETGYRVQYDSCEHATRSLIQCHNETFNIWSHFIGALACIALIVYINLRYESKSSLLSAWPISVFLSTAFLCQLFSAIYHTFYCISYESARKIIRLDFAGITLLFSGSCFPLYYYAFYCDERWGTLYLSLIGIFSVIIFSITLQDFIYEAKYYKARNFMFVALGIVDALPMVHVLVNYFTQKQEVQNSATYTPFYDPFRGMFWYGLMAVFYIGGVFVMNARCPERIFRITFDNCCQSHNIWHLMVTSAIAFTYAASLANYNTRLDSLC